MDDIIRILGFAGSLRKGSYNRAILRAAVELTPDDADLETFDLEGIGPFNQDLERDPPAKVVEFKSRIRAADALLIATPEYNYSIPGVLKNAIDAASRPFSDNPFDGKPVALMGASPGMIGTARAQYDLRRVCVFLNMYPVNRPEVMVSYCEDKIDQTGRVVDGQTRDKIRALLQALVAWTRRLNAPEYAEPAIF